VKDDKKKYRRLFKKRKDNKNRPLAIKVFE